MISTITALELKGVDSRYSIYMHQSAPQQLICRIETPRTEQNEPTKFMEGLKSLGVKTRRDDAAKKICAKATRLCDHSCCFGMTFTLLEKTLLAVWHTANKLYGAPKVIRILMTNNRENLVFDWTPETLSYHFAHQNPTEYIAALQKLQEFRSVEVQTDRGKKFARVNMTVNPGMLGNALKEARKILIAH